MTAPGVNGIMKSKHRFSPVATDGSLASKAPVQPQPSHEGISALARSIWEKRGRPHGQDAAIWLEAERRLRGGIYAAGDEDDVAADTRVLLDQPADTIEGRLEEFGQQGGPRSATSL
jgi:Protein of unknown function (DUF2934)